MPLAQPSYDPYNTPVPTTAPKVEPVPTYNQNFVGPISPNSSPQQTVVSTAQPAEKHISQMKQTLSSAQQQMAQQSALKASQPAQAQDPIVTEAMSPKPITEISNAAQFYRAYGRIPTSSELDAYVRSQSAGKLSDAASALSGSGTSGTSDTSGTSGTSGTGTTPPDSTSGTYESNYQNIENQFNPQEADIQAKIDANTQKMLDTLNQYQNGVTPLTSGQQAQIEATKKIFQDLKDAQILANKNAEGGMTNIQISSGRNRYAPEIAQGQIQATVDAGLKKLQSIDNQMASTISQMEAAFKSDNFAVVKQAYDMYNKALTDRQTVIQKTHDKALSFMKEMMDYNQKAAQQDSQKLATNLRAQLSSDTLTSDQKSQILDNAISSGKLLPTDANTVLTYWDSSKTKYAKELNDYLKTQNEAIDPRTGEITPIKPPPKQGNPDTGILSPTGKAWMLAVFNGTSKMSQVSSEYRDEVARGIEELNSNISQDVQDAIKDTVNIPNREALIQMLSQHYGISIGAAAARVYGEWPDNTPRPTGSDTGATSMVDTKNMVAAGPGAIVGLTNPSKGIVGGYNILAYATDPNHERAISSIWKKTSVISDTPSADQYVRKVAPKSPITGQMIMNSSKKFNVEPGMIMAMMQQDSSFGTAGKGARTRNPGNVGNDDTGATRTYRSWQEGVDAVAKWLDNHRASGGNVDVKSNRISNIG